MVVKPGSRQSGARSFCTCYRKGKVIVKESADYLGNVSLGIPCIHAIAYLTKTEAYVRKVNESSVVRARRGAWVSWPLRVDE